MKNVFRILCLFNCVIIVLISLTLHSFAASSSIINNEVYYIKNQRSGKYITAAGNTSGSNIYQSNFTGNTNQQFKLVYTETYQSNAYYNIVPMVNTSLRIDIDNAWDSDGANVKLFNYSSLYPEAQRFRFIYNNNNNRGTYRIMPRLSSTRVFDVLNASLYSGTNIQLYSSVPGAYQQDWILENVDDIDLFIEPDIAIYSQLENNTCGPASANMILEKFGIYENETDVKNRAQSIWIATGGNPNTNGFTYVYIIASTLNYFFEEEGLTTRYTYTYINGESTDDLAMALAIFADYGYPSQIVFKTTATTYLPYTTNGHYGVIGGVKYDNDSGTVYAVLCDPHWISSTTYHTGIWEIPMATMQSYNNAHSGYLIHAGDF